MKKILSILLFTSFIVFTFIASSTPKKVPEEQKRTFSFDYEVSEKSPPNSAGMLIALVNPTYADGFEGTEIELFQRFSSSIGADIEETLIAKGFRLKGPFSSKDEMVFIDKKDSDIQLEIEINPKFNILSGKWYEQLRFSSSTPPSYKYKGTGTIEGKINVYGYEPLTGEKILVKSVNIPKSGNIDLTTEKAYKSTKVNLMIDPLVYNNVGLALEKTYKNILDKLTSYLTKEELGLLKPQIKELKAKKGY